MKRQTKLSLAAVAAVIALSGVWEMLGCGGGGAEPNPVTRIYVANEDSGTVSVIDAETNTVFRTIDLADIDNPNVMFMAHNVQAAPDGQSVWVTAPVMDDMEGEEDEVVVFSAQTWAIHARIRLGMHVHPTHVVLDDASRYAYAVGEGTNAVYRIDARTYEIVGRYYLGAGQAPHGLRHFDGTLYVANRVGNSLSIIATETGDITEIPLGGAAVQTAVTPDGRYVFVSLYDTREVVRLERAALVLTRIPLPAGAQGPIQLYPSPDSRLLYAADQGMLLGRPASHKLFVIDVQDAAVIAAVTAGMGVHGVVVSPDGARLYVTNIADNTVSVIDAATRAVVATVPVGRAPNGISYGTLTMGQP